MQLDKLNKQAKKKIAFYGDSREVEKVDVIPTGIIPLDQAIGIGGIPRGKITDIYGLQSVGKSSLCFNTIAQAQKLGLRCVLVDAEYSYSPEFIAKFGVEPKKLIVIQPDYFEQAAEAIEQLLRDKVGLIVVDSVSALVPLAEAEAEAGKNPMAIQARLMSQMLRKTVSLIAKNNTAVIFLNQMRINIMGGSWDPYTVTGGFALRFYSHLRLEIKRTGWITPANDKKNVLGQAIKIIVRKNKLSIPGKECSVNYLYEGGFDEMGDLMSIAENAGFIQRQGNTYLYGEQKLATGRDKSAVELKKFQSEILDRIQQQRTQSSAPSTPD
jgi:recombination protein RecA